MNVHEVASHFTGAKPVGRDKYMAPSPLRQETKPSVAISAGRNGNVLIKDFGGGETEATVKAVGLTMTDLFPSDGTGHKVNYIGEANRPKPKRLYATLQQAIDGQNVKGNFVKCWQYSDDFAIARWNVGSTDKTIRPFRRIGDQWGVGDPDGLLPILNREEIAGTDTIYVVEGEPKVDACRSIELVGTCSSHGAKSASKSDWRPLAGKRVVILPDLNEAGEEYGNDVAEIVTGLGCEVRIVRLPDLPPGGDIVDWMELRDSAEPETLRRQIEAMVKAAPVWTAATSASTGPEPDLICMADVKTEAIRWLWPGRIALGKLTLIVGDPGLGKSFLTCYLSAAVSRGLAWPDDDQSAAPLGDVVLLNAEDDPADTIKPRLTAACADCSRIAVLQGVRKVDPKSGEVAVSHFSLERDLPMLRKALDSRPDTRLVVIDPVSAFLGQTDSHNNAEVRGLLAPLAALAGEYRVALVLVSHLNKGAGKSVYRTTGSLAFPAAARAVWCVAKDGDDPTGRRRLFLPVKNNLAEDHGGLAYSIQEGAIVWESGTVTVSADDALDGAAERPGPKPTTRTAAGDWLRELLADGPMASTAIKAAAGEAGLSWSSAVRRAREELGIRPYQEGFKGGWYWALPTDEHPDEHPTLSCSTCSTCSSAGATCSSVREDTHTTTTSPPREAHTCAGSEWQEQPAHLRAQTLDDLNFEEGSI